MKLFKDPLLHFLLIGALLFVLFAWRNDPEQATSTRIVVSAEEVAQVMQAAEFIAGQAPSAEQIAALVEPTVRAEVMYREALALGLDREDALVRNRLIEKMEYLSQDLVPIEAPTEAELERFFAAQAERFWVPERLDLEHLFFSNRLDDAAVTAHSALAVLREGAAPASEQLKASQSVLFEPSYSAIDPPRVTQLFGSGVSAALFELPEAEWQGPLQSIYGWHLFRILVRSPGYQPSFAQVHEAVAAAYLETQRQAANQQAYRELREKYQVVIEPPAQPRSP